MTKDSRRIKCTDLACSRPGGSLNSNQSAASTAGTRFTYLRACPNFRGKDTYSWVKVWNAEQSEAFGVAFMNCWRGRMKAQLPVLALRKIRSAPAPRIRPRTKEEIVRATLMAELVGIFEEASSKGYRSPHK